MLRIIQIGSGGWGLSWLRFIHESSEWELAGLVSRGGSNLDQAREQFAIPPSKCFTDLEQALKIDANAVLIAVPQHLHAAVAQQALLAGKHVLCEKPLSDTFEGAKAVARFADTTDRKLCVVQNFRYRHGLWQLKAVIEQSLGRLDSLNVSAHCPQGENMPDWRRTQRHPLLVELAIHHVDMARFLMNTDARKIFCRAWNPAWSRTESAADAAMVIEFNNGALMTYRGSWAARGCITGWEGQWRVQCENGAALWDKDALIVENAQKESISAPEIINYPGEDRAGVLQAFAESIQNGTPFGTEARDNLKSLGIIFAAIRSAEEGREVYVEELLDGLDSWI